MKLLVLLSTLFLIISATAMENSISHQLYIAIKENQIEKVLQLIKAGASVNNPCNGSLTPLRTASYLGHTPIVKLLLHYNASINYTDSFGDTALSFACQYHKVETVKILLKRGANINKATKSENYPTPLHIASFAESTEILKILLSYGADTTIKNSKNQTALDSNKTRPIIAYKEKVQEIVDILSCPKTIAQLKKDREDTVRKKSLLKIEQLRLIQSITQKSPSIDIPFLLLLERT